MTGAPFYYNYRNAVTSMISPSMVHIHNTAVARYFRRYLLERAKSVYKWKMPDEWAENYALACLYEWGFFSVLNTRQFGIIPQAGTLGSYTVMYQPRVCVISNPLFDRTYELVIGRDCEIVYLMDDYNGLMDIVDYYADMMALACETAGLNLHNSKMTYVFGVQNKAGAETMKKLFDKINSGEPAVVTDKELINREGEPSWQMFNQNVGQNFIAPDVFTCIKNLESMFDTEIGVPNNAVTKKERVSTDETNSNNVATYTAAAKRLELLQKCCKNVNAMFGKELLSVDWRNNPLETVSDDNGIQTSQQNDHRNSGTSQRKERV